MSIVRTTGVVFFVFAVGCDGSSSGGSASSAGSAMPAPSTSAATASSASSASTESRQVPAKVPDTIVAQHILVAYKGAQRVPRTISRSKADAKIRADEALAKIRAGAEFEDIVQLYSDDPGSLERRGLLGKIHKADLDPKFSAAAFALQVDQVSEVVETPFGFHIIKRTQ